MRKVTMKILAILVVGVLVLAACAPATETPTEMPGTTEPPAETTEPPAETTEPPQETETPTEETQMPTEESGYTYDVEQGAFEGEEVNVIAVWGGSEQESFEAMVAPWEEYTGATLQYEGTRDLNAVLQTRIEGGNPPDIAGIPGPGALQQFAEAGDLVDLTTFMDMEQLQADYNQSWLDLASYKDGLYGLFTKVAVKSLVWYNPPAFNDAGYEIPETWDQMISLSDTVVQDGNTPWAVGLESGAASGWPFTDWVEDIMLRTAGPDVYDQWVNHEIPWTDDRIKNAWEMAGMIMTNNDYVVGGVTGVLATNFGESIYPLYQDPPSAYLHRNATFMQGFITDQFPDLQAIDDYNYFLFPSINEEYGKPVLSAGDLFGMFNDTEAARSLMKWLASAQAQEIWAARGGFISPNKNTNTDVYPNPILKQAAELLTTADIVRFDASDLMSSAVNEAFWAGALNYVENPDNLDQILQNIEDVAASE
mgnify:CR=1 FL=1